MAHAYLVYVPEGEFLLTLLHGGRTFLVAYLIMHGLSQALIEYLLNGYLEVQGLGLGED